MSSICENCGKEFEEEDAREEFESETGKCFEYLTKCLCAECAIEAKPSDGSRRLTSYVAPSVI